MSNPCVPDIPAQPVRLFVVNGKWAVPVDQRPPGWKTWGVGKAIPDEHAEKPARPQATVEPSPPRVDTASVKGGRKCKLVGCENRFAPRNAQSRYCSRKCMYRAKDVRKKEMRAAGGGA